MEQRGLSDCTRPSRSKLLIIAALVSAGLLSTAMYLQPRSWFLKPHMGPVELGALDIQMPALPSYDLNPDIAYNLGPYSPRYAVPSNISSDLPQGCAVSMVNILQRHGARYPTTGAGEKIAASLAKLKLVHSITDPSLQFVPNFTYSFVGNQLVPFGRAQSYISGQIIAKKYAALGTTSFVRAADKARIVESSRWWRQGFEGRPFETDLGDLPQPDLAIPISVTSNNTLGVKTCVAAMELKPSPGSIAGREWLSTFAPPTTRRLNRALPGANLTDSDIPNLMSLCGFDTAARNGTASPWCNVFTHQEWKNNQYYHDLDKYYSWSYGSRFAPSEGAGWVNELLARLTGTPVRDNTTTNSTLNSDPSTFPSGPLAPRIFADFSSDNNIMKIISALGILRDRISPPPSGPIPLDQKMVVSRVVPFAACTVVEKVTCSAHTKATTAGDYVRILVNDAVVPLPSCGTLGYTSGMCTIDEFVQSQAFSRAGGDFASCFATKDY